MQEKIKDGLNNIAEKIREMDRSLKIKLGVLVLAILVALALTVYLTIRPKWVVLESNSDISTLGQIQNIYNDASIKNKITKNGTAIQVQEKDVDQAKILLAEKNITKQGFTFDDAFQTSSIGMTSQDKKEMYLQASETALARHIERIDGIESANVKLVTPDDSVLFNKEEKQASASITVATSRDITKQQAETIARLVCMSVEGLTMENITIVDQNANNIYSYEENQNYDYQTKEEIERAKQQEIENKIRAALVQLYDDVNIIANIKVDWNQRQQKSITYTPPVDEASVGVPSKQVKESESVSNGTVGDEPGLESNDENPTNYAIGTETAGTYDSSKENTDYLYNTVEDTVTVADGQIVPDESSISVVVYKLKEYKEENLKKDKTISGDMTWAKFQSENSAETKLEIDPDLVTNLRVGTGIENLNVVGFEKPIFIDAEPVNIAVEQIILLIVLAVLLILLAIALIKKTEPEEEPEPVVPLEIEDIIASDRQAEEQEKEQLNTIEEYESEYKIKIDSFIDEKPEAVAALLRNWLNDDME